MDDLLTDIEAFLEAHQMAETTFGRRAANDATLLRDMREGRELRRATAERIRQFMVTYRPESAAA
jgi:hypothetical protein